jgi:hypothetical protein
MGSTLLRRSALALLLGAATSALVAAGCSGRSSRLDGPGVSDGEGGEGEPGPSAGRGGHAGSGGAGASGRDAGMDATGGTAGIVPTDAPPEPPYVDPGCPDAATVPGTIECDPFTLPSGCAAGFACKPSIEHPFGDGCDQQRFNMLCRPAGFGVQGDECASASDCADGFLCVVGAGAGKLCLRMCPLDGTGSCPSGYICGETDALGVGVCA